MSNPRSESPKSGSAASADHAPAFINEMKAINRDHCQQLLLRRLGHATLIVDRGMKVAG
jgi:hypothetical protein